MSSSSKSKLTTYQPLVVILVVITLGAEALKLATGEGFMRYFMGLFFLIFALFKLLDLPGFAKGYQKYDIVAQQSRAYAYLYPFLELGLGLAYLAYWQMGLVLKVTVVLMFVSAAGVIREVRRGNQFQCACLGTTLNVPLSTVSIVENVGMGLMALAMLFA